MKALTLSGTSMWPALKTGDLVIVDQRENLSVGDIVVREIDGVTIAHRYLGRELTKGDRYSVADPRWIDRADSAWTVIRVVPRRIARNHVAFQKSMALEPRTFTRVLSLLGRVQTWLSRLQAKFAVKPAKRALLLPLLANGLMIRCLYYLKSLGAFHVMPNHE